MWCLGPSRCSHTASYRCGHALSTPLSRDLCLSTHQMSVTHKSDGITTCSQLCAHTKTHAHMSRETAGKNQTSKSVCPYMNFYLFRKIVRSFEFSRTQERIHISTNLCSVTKNPFSKRCWIWNICMIPTPPRSYLLWKQIILHACV